MLAMPLVGDVTADRTLAPPPAGLPLAAIGRSYQTSTWLQPISKAPCRLGDRFATLGPRPFEPDPDPSQTLTSAKPSPTG